MKPNPPSLIDLLPLCDLASPHWGRSTRLIFFPATFLQVLPLPKPPFHSPGQHSHTTPTAYPEFPLSALRHLPGLCFLPQLSPGNLLSEGAGLLSNLSGPTHSDHMRSVIGGSLHPQPGAGRRRAAGRKSERVDGVKSCSKKDCIRGGRSGQVASARACPGGLREPASVGFVSCPLLFSISS